MVIYNGIISEPILNIYYYIGDDDPEQKDPSSTNRPQRQNNNSLGFYGGRGGLFLFSVGCALPEHAPKSDIEIPSQLLSDCCNI